MRVCWLLQRPKLRRRDLMRADAMIPIKNLLTRWVQFNIIILHYCLFDWIGSCTFPDSGLGCFTVTRHCRIKVYTHKVYTFTRVYNIYYVYLEEAVVGEQIAAIKWRPWSELFAQKSGKSRANRRANLTEFFPTKGLKLCVVRHTLRNTKCYVGNENCAVCDFNYCFYF